MGKIVIKIAGKTIECDGTEPISVFVSGIVSQTIFEFIGENKKYVLRVTEEKKLLFPKP